MDRTEKLSIEEKSYRQNRNAIDRTGNGYRLIRMAINRTEKLSIEQKSYRQNNKAIDRTEKLSIEQKMAMDRS